MGIEEIEILFSEQAKKEPSCEDSWRAEVPSGDPCDGSLFYVIVSYEEDGSLRRSTIVLCDRHLDGRGLS